MSCIEYVIERSSTNNFIFSAWKSRLLRLGKPSGKICRGGNRYLFFFFFSGLQAAILLTVFFFFLSGTRIKEEIPRPTDNVASVMAKVALSRSRAYEEEWGGGKHKIIPVDLVYPLPLYRIERRLLWISLCPGVSLSSRFYRYQRGLTCFTSKERFLLSLVFTPRVSRIVSFREQIVRAVRLRLSPFGWPNHKELRHCAAVHTWPKLPPPP